MNPAAVVNLVYMKSRAASGVTELPDPIAKLMFLAGMISNVSDLYGASLKNSTLAAPNPAIMSRIGMNISTRKVLAYLNEINHLFLNRAVKWIMNILHAPSSLSSAIE